MKENIKVNIFSLLNRWSLQSSTDDEVKEKMNILRDGIKEQRFYFSNRVFEMPIIREVYMNNIRSVLNNKDLAMRIIMGVQEGAKRLSEGDNEAEHICDVKRFLREAENESDIQVVLQRMEAENFPATLYSVSVDTQKMISDNIAHLVSDNYESGLQKYLESYIKEYYDRAKEMGENLEENKMIDNFDPKDESSFPHIHIKIKRKKVAINLIDIFFDEDKLMKHGTISLENDLNKKVLKELQKNRFKTF